MRVLALVLMLSGVAHPVGATAAEGKPHLLAHGRLSRLSRTALQRQNW